MEKFNNKKRELGKEIQPEKKLPKEIEEIDSYFGNVAGKYEVFRPVSDSIVRLEDEAKIAEKLRAGKPILIRGV